MPNRNKPYTRMSERIRSWLNPLRVAGLGLISFGLLVLLVPQVLVAIVASLFLFAGVALVATPWQPRVHREAHMWHTEPLRMRSFDPFEETIWWRW